MGRELAAVFAQMLDEFSISDKVGTTVDGLTLG